jgi:hypothetical protein
MLIDEASAAQQYGVAWRKGLLEFPLVVVIAMPGWVIGTT